MKALEIAVRLFAVGFTLAAVMCIIFPQGGKKDTVPLKAFVKQSCEKAGVSYPVCEAVIEQESNWNPEATNVGNRNGTTDHGLMQINSRTAKEYGLSIRDLYDPKINVLAGLKKLQECKQRAAVALSKSKTAPRKRDYFHRVFKCYNGSDKYAHEVLARLEDKLIEGL